MNTSSPEGGNRTRRFTWSAPIERIGVQVLHLGAIVVIAAFIFVLALRGELDHASVTALYGGILGHLGTSASQKLSARSTDGVPFSRRDDADS